ncbi:MAG: SpoIIE family protein phosphatase, partial [Bacteroidota bacterium]|nr:SpoIIE family protein phosphatase [Bacteroidota bacterium]
LNTKLIIPSYNKVLNFFKWVLLIGLLLCLVNYNVYLVMQHIINFLGPFSTLMVIVGAVLCYKHEPVLSKYLIFAFSLLIWGILLEVTRNTGFSYNSDYGLKIGHASEAIIIAFALAVRFKINNDKNQTLALERLENLNQLKDQYNAELERTVEQRTSELHISNSNLNDSILYARHIQYSLLPPKSGLGNYFEEYFIYFKPKEIISGDFYWFEKVGDKLIIAVVDCTGHGVPGAFMSMLGSTILRQTVKVNQITDPEQILKILDSEIRSTLQQTQEDPYNKDGMDICLIVYDIRDFSLKFAGAKRPLIYVSNSNEMTIYKGSKFSIGGDVLGSSVSKNFMSESIHLQKGDRIFLFTDGIIDQFGGEHSKKFMMNRFKNLICQIQEFPVNHQGKKIEEEINSWKGNQEQVDDILVIGLKF